FEDRTKSYGPHNSGDYVWVVQFEGESTDRFETTHLRYAGCAVDAADGVVRQEFRRAAEPLLLPKSLLNRLPSEASDVNLGTAVEAQGPVSFSREAAKGFVASKYGRAGVGRGDWTVGSKAEIELVRYTGLCHGKLTDAAAATPTPGGPPVTPGPRRVQCGVEWGWEDSRDRLTWLVIIPVEIDLSPCGPGASQGYFTCWSQPLFILIDAETGEQYGDGGTGGIMGPRVTNAEFQALSRYAWAESWWDLWHEVRAYAGQPLPDGLAASLDRPDAPTPTPFPSPVVPSDVTTTPTPTPAPGSPPVGPSGPTPTLAPAVPSQVSTQPRPQGTVVLAPTIYPTPTPRPRLAALIQGVLVDRNGCLAVGESPGDQSSYALVWSKDWHVVVRNAPNVTVTDTYDGRTTTVTWRIGDQIEIGGGSWNSNPPVPLDAAPNLYTVGTCDPQGLYWLVGDVK
ncbi:MAG: hypothetical protein HY682_01955, partial [Chloroflexi bacterium]|nr:hypothetical protein [Chloroflexota bacterium]